MLDTELQSSGSRETMMGRAVWKMSTGRGRIFFFSPGHETYPIYHEPVVHKVISNGIRWVKQTHTDGRVLANWHRAEPLHGRPDGR